METHQVSAPRRPRLRRSRDPGKPERYEQRKLAGLCTTCGEQAVPDRQQCAPCLEKARKATAKAMKRQRHERRQAGLCSTGCGRPSLTYRCFVCAVRAGELPASSPAESGVNAGVNAGRDRTRGVTVAVTEGDGRTRNRYVGQGRRGRLSHADEDAADARQVAAQVERAVKELEQAHSEEVQRLPLTQRRDAMHAALARFDLVCRFIGEILERHKYGR